MAQQPRQFTIEKQTYKGAVPDGLAPVPMPTGEAGQAAAAGFDALAKKFSTWADQDAKFEGERDAKVAAATGDFTRTGAATIYGRARDATALDLQVQNVTSQYRDSTMRLFDQHRNDPAALQQALEAQARENEAVLPAEARAAFRARASDIGVVLQRQALNNAEAARLDRGRAHLIRSTAGVAAEQARAAANDPQVSPETQREIYRLRDQQLADIAAAESGGFIDAAKAETERQRVARDAEGTIIQARASTLRTPEEVEAFRNKLREDARQGRLPQTVDLAAVDDALQKLGQQKRVEGDRVFREFNARVDDALGRAAKGQIPPPEELAALEAEAGRTGPRGQQALATARELMGHYNRMAGMSLADQDRYAREVIGNLRRASTAVSSLPAGMRNNNPGNIKYVAGLHSRYEGVVGPSQNTDQGDPQAVFASPEAGMRAAYLLARRKYDGGKVTAAQLIAGQGGWTPGNMAAAGNIARMAGVGVNDDLGLSDPARASRFMRALFNQEHGEGPARAYSDEMIASAISGAPLPPPRSPATLSRGGSQVADALQSRLEANRNLIQTDPLAYANQMAGPNGTTLLGAPITEVDFRAPPDQLGAQVAARVRQVESIASITGPAPVYLRPAEKAELQGQMQQGGERALRTVQAIIAGSGSRAPQVLKEIGGDAPAIAHAAAIASVTNDDSFALGVVNALAYRSVNGAPRDAASRVDFEEVGRTTLGAAMNALPPAERARTATAVQLWWENEVRLRGFDPKGDPAKQLLVQGYQRARGGTVVNDVEYGGIGSYKPAANWFSAENVQVPPNVRRDSFGDVLKAITDEDMAAGGSRPVKRNGQPMTAASEMGKAAPMISPTVIKMFMRTAALVRSWYSENISGSRA